MRSYSINIKLLCLVSFLYLTGSAVSQDLGSSNKLFGGAKPNTPAKTVKKPTAKHKPAVKPYATTAKRTSAPKKITTAKADSVPKKKSPPPKTARVVSKPGPDTVAAKPKFTEFHNTKTIKAEVTTSYPKEINVPGNAAADALFEKLIRDGNNARDDRNYSTAEAAYRRAAGIKPRDPRAVYGLGNVYSDQQRWEDAEKSYRTALQIDSRDPIAYIALSYVLSQPVSVSNLSDRYAEAEKLARRSIELGPANPLAFDQLGVTLELRGLISAETENAYRKSIQLDPGFAPAYAHLGRLLRRRGLTREAAVAYQSAIQRSTDVGTMILVAEVMQSEQRYAESEQLLRMALDKDPKNPSALLLFGRALTTRGNFADAEKILKRSLAVSPDGFMPNSLLGSLYSRQGKFELAENALLQAMRYVPESEKRRLSQQFETIGDGYLKSGKRREAERSYRQAMALDAENTALAAKLAKTRGG